MDWKGSLDEQSEWESEVDSGRMAWELLAKPYWSMLVKFG